MKNNGAGFEYDQMCDCIAWLDSRFPELSKYCFHVPNDFSGGVAGRIRRKAQGVRAGVPDLMHLLPANGYHGLVVEFKAAKPNSSRLSTDQARWLARLADAGYLCCVCRGFNEYRETVERYFCSDRMASMIGCRVTQPSPEQPVVSCNELMVSELKNSI